MIKLFEKIYFEVESNTRDQLTKDFGEFPPAGLVVDDSLFGNFRVAFANRVGFLFYYAKRVPALIEITANSELIQMESLSQSFGDVQARFLSLNILQKVIFAIFAPIILFPLVVVLFFYAVFALSRTVLRMNEPEIGGCFIPTPKGEPEFVIRRECYLEKGEKLDAYIAHEHLHLLQYLSFLRNFKSLPVRQDWVRVEGFIKQKYCSNHYILYLYRKDEVEARLHELVLSFYRVNRSLPDSIEGLAGLIGLNLENEGISLKILRLDEEYFLRCYQYKPYPTRYASLGRQFSMILASISEFEDEIRFVFEVLSVMYANLLEYYGDHDASMRFRSLIQGPGLYDRLYG